MFSTARTVLVVDDDPAKRAIVAEYLASQREIGTAYRDVIGEHYPAMTLVQVADLLEERAKVEIEVTAVIPN